MASKEERTAPAKEERVARDVEPSETKEKEPAARASKKKPRVRGRLVSIRFGLNRASVRSNRRLRSAAAYMKAHPEVTFRVVGYTDSLGPEDYNLELSRKRADSVVDGLVELGVDRSRLISVGEGEENPVASNSTAQGRARNRRVVFKPE